MKYEAVIGLEVHTELKPGQKYSAAARLLSEPIPIPMYVLCAWDFRGFFPC